MVRKKLSFDWSAVDRHSVSMHLWSLFPKIIGKKLTVPEIHNILSRKIKSVYPVGIRKTIDNTVKPGVVYMGGEYYSDKDKKRTKCIVIRLVYHSTTDKYIMNTTTFWQLCVCFADTMLHEIIHMRQYRRRRFKYLPEYQSTAEKVAQREEQIYLGSSDEIDAYGFNIACSLMEKFNNDNFAIVQYLNENYKKTKYKQTSWKMYLKAFDYNHDHVIIKRLKKKIIRYFPHAAVGKPYKNKNWINR